MNTDQFVKRHIVWLEGRAFMLREGIKHKPHAKDIREAREELRYVNTIIRVIKKGMTKSAKRKSS